MVMKQLLTVAFLSSLAVLNGQTIPDRSDKAYQTIVDTGAKLLGYDIERESINTNQKKLATDAGKTMGALEQIAKRFDDVVAATIALEKNFQNSTEPNKNESAVVALVKLLSHPNDLFTTTDNPEYRPAKDYAATATYIKEVQRIAQQQFPETASKLSQNASAFFDILRQTIINNFRDLLKNHPELKATLNNDQSYQALVDTSTKLLALDIAREKINNAQKQFVKDTEKQSITSSDGKKISVMGSIEHINQRFDDVVISLVILENSIKKSQTDNSNALTALVQILSHPEDQASFNTKLEYKAAMDNQSTANFIRKIQNFANASGKENSAKINLFYDIIKQTIINMFGSLIQVKEETKATQPTDIKTKPSLSPQEMLQAAIMKDSVEEIEKALEAGADVNYKSGDVSLLIMALQMRKEKAAQTLMRHGIKIEGNVSGMFPVELAIWKGETQSALALLKAGGEFSSWVLIYLMAPEKKYSKNDINEIIQALIAAGYQIGNIAINVWEYLIRGLHNEFGSYPEIFAALIKNGANPNQDITCDPGAYKDKTTTPLLLAIKDQNLDVVKMLLNVGAQIDKKAFVPGTQSAVLSGIHTPLSLAIFLGASEIAEFLIAHGAQL